MKDLKVVGKKLTFDIASVSIRTKAGRFLTSKVTRQPCAKKILRVQKQFSRKHHTYIQVTVCGNIFGIRKYHHFVKEFHEIISVIMGLEPSLVIIPYPGGAESHKGHPFAHEATILVSSYECKIYTNDIYIADGKPTTVKVFVGHDSPAAIFNSLELGQLADEKDGSVRVCHIKVSKVVVMGYLNGSTKTLNVYH